MKKLLSFIIIVVVFPLVSCSKDQKLLPEENLVIPNDVFAIYIIEAVHEYIDLNTITLDSIKRLSNKIIDYQDIVSYDTSSFAFELIGVSKEHIDSLDLARYARRYPLAAVSEGQILFYVYLNHPALSSLPNFYYFEPYTLPDWAKGYLYFCPPPFANLPLDQDQRMNSTMLQIFESDNKLI
jgi:hypothetical protein